MGRFMALRISTGHTTNHGRWRGKFIAYETWIRPEFKIPFFFNVVLLDLIS
jgi:hypothetical protein